MQQSTPLSNCTFSKPLNAWNRVNCFHLSNMVNMRFDYDRESSFSLVKFFTHANRLLVCAHICVSACKHWYRWWFTIFSLEFFQPYYRIMIWEKVVKLVSVHYWGGCTVLSASGELQVHCSVIKSKSVLFSTIGISVRIHTHTHKTLMPIDTLFASITYELAST